MHRLMLITYSVEEQKALPAWSSLKDPTERARPKKEAYYIVSVQNLAMVACLEQGHALMRATISTQMRSEFVPGFDQLKQQLAKPCGSLLAKPCAKTNPSRACGLPKLVTSFS